MNSKVLVPEEYMNRMAVYEKKKKTIYKAMVFLSFPNIETVYIKEKNLFVRFGLFSLFFIYN